MFQNQAAFRRRARSVCIVTDLPVRLQGKKKQSTKRESGTQIMRLGSVVLAVRLTATGEIVIEVEPP